MAYEGFYSDRTRLKNAYKGIGDSTAEKILKEFGGIEGLHETTRSEFTSVRGLGSGTADKIGIWDGDGNPVGTVTENPCPCCHETYQKSASGSAILEDVFVEYVYAYTEYDSDSVTLYIHEME
jgi:hypothetical protein